MPNWCENTLTITGPEKSIRKLKRQAVIKTKSYESDFSFHKFIIPPKEMDDIHTGGCNINGKYVNVWREVNGENIEIPDADLSAMRRQYGVTNLYDFNCKYLGTKWDVTSELESSAKGELNYRFDSAWNPPIVGIEQVSRMFPDLVFHLSFDEPGCDFAGYVTYKNGDCIGSEDTKSPSNVDEGRLNRYEKEFRD